MTEDRNDQLHRLLDALAELLATVTDGNEDMANRVRNDLDNGGCLILGYRPKAGRVEISLGTADKEPIPLFEAMPAAESTAVSINSS